MHRTGWASGQDWKRSMREALQKAKESQFSVRKKKVFLARQLHPKRHKEQVDCEPAGETD